MSSQLNVDTILDKAGSGGSNVKMANTSTYVSDGGGATQNTVQGLAKAWMQQTTGTTINGSFNCSSLSDNGTGDYTTLFTNDMANDDYACQCTGADANTNASIVLMVMNSSGYAAGSARMFFLNEDSGAADGGPNSITVNGDLA